MSKTFIIPQPYKTRHFVLSEQDKKDNKVSRTEALAGWLAFAKEVASHFKKGWFVELKDEKDEHLYVNGNLVSARFKDDYLLVSNNQSRMGIKKVAQFYYGTELTMKKHGAKLVAVIEDVIARNIRDNASRDKVQENIKLGVEIMKELVHNHNFQFSTIVGLVNQMGREFVVISKIVPEIVKKIKG